MSDIHNTQYRAAHANHPHLIQCSAEKSNDVEHYSNESNIFVTRIQHHLNSTSAQYYSTVLCTVCAHTEVCTTNAPNVCVHAFLIFRTSRQYKEQEMKKRGKIASHQVFFVYPQTTKATTPFTRFRKQRCHCGLCINKGLVLLFFFRRVLVVASQEQPDGGNLAP